MSSNRPHDGSGVDVEAFRLGGAKLDAASDPVTPIAVRLNRRIGPKASGVETV